MVIFLEFLGPIMAAAVGSYSAIAVAKINRVHKEIKTGAGSSNIGESVDVIRSLVNTMSDNQDVMIHNIEGIKQQSRFIKNRLEAIEDVARKNHPEDYR